MNRFVCAVLLFLLSCGVESGFESLGEEKVCDSIKVRVRACTGRGVEEWGGCDAVDERIGWDTDFGLASMTLEMRKLEDC